MENEDAASEYCLSPQLEKRPGAGKRSKNCKEAFMIIDEIGDPSDRKTSSDVFGFAITIIDGLEEFGGIADRNRKDKDYEMKSKDATDREKEKMISRIVLLEPEIYGIYVDKRRKDVPDIWLGKDRPTAYRMVLKEAVRYIMRNTKRDNFFVMIDYNTALKGNGRTIIEDAVRENHKSVKDYEETNSEDHDFMQTHDFVAGALYAHLVDKNDKWVSKLKMKIKRLERRK